MRRGKRRDQRESTRREIGALFSEPNQQKRGKAWAGLLNCLFGSFDILIREGFTVQGVEGEGVIAQIDGAIALDNHIYLVEMKWLNEKVGPGDVAQHLDRVMFREGARGLFISATDYTPAAKNALCQALNHRVQVGTQLQEIVFALEKATTLRKCFERKSKLRFSIRDPFHFISFR